ncbi:MAG: hypothetical protein EPN45_19385 [Rhizobiaceae bacterium]|nr:MAG: hypothetical protein EPN45_19385 [Rhizobiaceae bacterium]
MKKLLFVLAIASAATGAMAADAASVAVEGHACRNLNAVAKTKDGALVMCVDADPKNVWKLASDPTASHLCQKNGKTTNPDGTVVQCRIEGGKVVPIN